MAPNGWLEHRQAELQALAPEAAVHRVLDFAVEQGMSDLFFQTCEDDLQVSGRFWGCCSRYLCSRAILGDIAWLISKPPPAWTSRKNAVLSMAAG